MLLLLCFMDLPGACVVIGTNTLLSLCNLLLFPWSRRVYLELEENPFLRTVAKHLILSLGSGLAYWIAPFSISCASWGQFIGWSMVFGCVSLAFCAAVQLDRGTRQELKSLLQNKLRREDGYTLRKEQAGQTFVWPAFLSEFFCFSGF